MKYTKFIAVGAICAVLPSCGLLQSAGRVPGTLLQAVARTAGLTVSHEGEVPKSEVEKKEEEAGKVY